jgi:hypothetical protein
MRKGCLLLESSGERQVLNVVHCSWLAVPHGQVHNLLHEGNHANQVRGRALSR